MLYRLLRNNKESGPYTAVQLREMGLKPYDLLWAEGRGAAWQYASELPELKSFAPAIEEQPFDRFFKKKEAQPVSQQQPVVVEKKTKPRFRISGDKIIMVEAGNMEVANNGSIKETAPQTRLPKEPVIEEKVITNPQWQDMFSEWQPQKKSATTEAPVEIETKYSESLDDLKKRYAEKVLNDKGEKKTSVFASPSFKQNITAAIALLVIVVGGYIGYTLKQKDTATITEGKPALERADVIGDNALSAQSTTDAGNNAATDDNKTKQNNSQPESKLEKNNEAISKVKPTVEKPVPATLLNNKVDNKAVVPVPQKKELKNQIAIKKTDITDKKTPVVNANNNNTAGKIDVQPANTTAKTTVNNTVSSAPVDTKPIVKQNVQKKIDDYVSIKKVGGSANAVENVRLLVSNVTDFPIDLAVVDIQYFDSKGKFQKGETMYVKNIDGGNNVEVRVPDSEKSSSIKYKVSLVSSEKKTLYLVAD